MAKQAPVTIVRLSQPVTDGRREHDALYLTGRPGTVALPSTVNGEETEIDAVAVARVIAERTGLSQSAVAKLAAVDLVTIMFTLFAPAARAKR
jgi:hypothetical protein